MKNNFKYLALLFLILLIASYFVIQNNKTTTDSETVLLIPELKTQINDVEEITISKNDDIINLTKKSGIWRIKQANNYLADANMIASLLLDLRKFELKEKKTSKPENFAHLSLDEKGENAATQIVLNNAHQQFADVLIGKKSQNSQGIYVRKNNDNQAWLSEGSLNVKINPSDWIVSNILDINSSQIKSVTYQSDGEEFTIDKITPQDAEFGLVNMPENMQLKNSVNLSELANGLQKFSIETADVRNNQNSLLTVTYQLFSGMKYILNISQVEETYYLTIDLENADSASEFHRQLQDWTFVIASYKFNALNKKLDELIEPKQVETEDNEAELNE